MQSQDPTSVAVAFRLALVHLARTSKRVQTADVIQQAETKLVLKVGATALEAVSHEGLQGATEPEDLMKSSESRNSVPD